MTVSMPSRERWIELEPLLDAALELAPAARETFLHELSHRDPEAAIEVRALVRACELSDDMLAAPAALAFAPLLTEDNHTIPPRLGTYTVLRELGRGGMATVYLAEDAKHARQVAIKVLHVEVARAIGRERFMREIEIAASLSHPHILPLHDSGEALIEHGGDGAPESLLYFVSPVMTGESLFAHLERKGPMQCEEVVRLGRELAIALDYAHRRGVAHLDIKPGNILLQDGHAVIADFGIARAISDFDERGSHDGAMLLGTPSYMSPEQAMGTPDLDGRSDIYSLGCVLHELLTGKRPVARDASYTPANADEQLAHADFRELRSKAPAQVVAPIVKAMATNRDDRFATAAEFAFALKESQLQSRPRLTARRIVVYGVLLTVLGAIGALVVANRVTRMASGRAAAAATTAATPAVTDKSIAVLPFENLGASAGDQYFADGLTEDLITLFARSADVRVVAYRAVSDLRDVGLQTREVARRLHVSYLMRGNVRKVDNRVLVSAQLVDAASGAVLWSSSYDRQFGEFLVVRNEIATAAVRALKTNLLASALADVATTHDAESYNLVLRGRALFTEVTRDNITSAIAVFQQAIARNPRNAAAYAGLARAYRTQAGQGWVPIREGSERARKAAQRAIDIDPQLADGYEALAFVQSVYDWKWDEAESNFRRALALEPGNARVLRSAALLMMKVGRYEEAIAGMRKAVERDPFAGTYDNLGYALGATGRWDEAEVAARTALTLGPNGILRHFNLSRALLFEGRLPEALREAGLEKQESWRLLGLATVYHALGRHAESDHALAEFESRFAEHSAMQIAEVHAWRGDRDAAFRWLDRAYAQRDPGITDLKDDPWLAGIRDDARFTVMLRKLSL